MHQSSTTCTIFVLSIGSLDRIWHNLMLPINHIGSSTHNFPLCLEYRPFTSSFTHKAASTQVFSSTLSDLTPTNSALELLQGTCTGSPQPTSDLNLSASSTWPEPIISATVPPGFVSLIPIFKASSNFSTARSITKSAISG